MNVCGCGYQPGDAGHRPFCPWPLFRAGPDEWQEWERAYEQARTAARVEAHGGELDADVYRHPDYPGVAWRIDGPETEPDEDTEWSGYDAETGRVRCHMVGDDRTFAFDPTELVPLDEDAYCAECGQIGCTADGRERTA